MERFVIGDLHLGHNNIIDYCGRPFVDTDDMNEQLITNWNNVVNTHAKVYVNGDVCNFSEMLGSIFGYHLNTKNYKVLNHNVGIIQGDGMNEKSIPKIYSEYIKTGWSAENFVTGSGGGLLVDGLTRDTDRWAIKVSYVEIDGNPVSVSKTPKSDMTKSSKAGKLKLHKVGNSFSTLSSSEMSQVSFNSYVDNLEVVFENGQLLRDQTFEDIRNTASKY